MTRTPNARAGAPSRRRTTWRERALVLGGFALAVLYTVVSAAAGFDMDVAGLLWLAAVLWTVPTSLALALRRGFRDRDWSAFRGHQLPDDTELVDWSTKSGTWYELAILEENERLMRAD